ncbi:translation elongation factor 4 [Candidatus Liberibacter solanacearum]|uniref:Elongation factor 4 n=1 Tax=Candidatus Liberibacter solanacearum TaxID=556287 RepID=A0A1V2N7M0_9HYPH|nr:translation elongation factor 4 [Candidatus Liberibacter solanacearum]ONI58906.1 elongation factor 4 [Candidatus Liberibacter solanacearum]ONI59334.1 elongation factor 4 [Candidatus Liberibacter solanacearum]
MQNKPTPLSRIRNFSIVAHIDHGKSTLADRFIQYCRGLTEREMSSQVLDNMDIERERGITIKAQTVRLNYTSENGQDYLLNLIDTPGHVDFTYEVSRSLSACEGSLLVVDASQGVEAQTIANVYQAIDNNHELITVLNKADLPSADPERVKKQIEETIGINTDDSLLISAKTGEGIQQLLEKIIQQLPHPTSPEGENAPLKALLIDSWYNSYLGVMVLVRIINGKLTKGQTIRLMGTNAKYKVERIGILTPKMVDIETLYPGEIGVMMASIKEVSHTRVGDTITDDDFPTTSALPGFKEIQPVVFCGLFPVDSSQFENLRTAIKKLRLNDASFSFELENSTALGFGFRCGFLGLLHLEIIQERLEREFDLDLIGTSPSVVYNLSMRDGSVIELSNPSDMPDITKISELKEPWISVTIITPTEYLGSILKLCQERRGIQIDMNHIENRTILAYELPLNEVIFDFYDRLKSVSRGYASFDYTVIDYRNGDLVKLTILVNDETVDALSILVHRSVSEKRGRGICEKLKNLIPQQMFQIAIQAAIGGRIIARETVKARRKDVTAKCYGGDITRKRKLLEKQKDGKKRMRRFGKVDIPQNAFISILKSNNE